jgi:hypothetical protein
LGGLLIVSSIPVLFAIGILPTAPSLTPSSADATGFQPVLVSARASTSGLVARDPTLWPFSRDSIWNLPIGAGAAYVAANIQRPTSAGMTTDPDVLILTPSAPMTTVWYNSDAWGGGSRCNAQGSALFDAPIPTDFVVPGAGGGSTPNFATAILLADNHTLKQGQPMARCTPGGTATMWWYMTNDLYGTGEYGGHGGSMLSSLGGTIRLGELVPGGVIRHALKVNLYGAVDLYYDSVTHGYRWPAKQADGCASGCYGGSVSALRMGSLLALPPAVDIASMGLETNAARILALAFQDYGAYVVDDTAWSVYGIATEFSPRGRIEDEFLAAWNFSIDPASRSVPWARDMDRIFGSLAVVDNWDATRWATVSASNGTLGAGLGSPRVPWAPEFGPDGIPPVASISLSGTRGSADWFVSSVDVTLSATDVGTGVASIHVRIDGGSWQIYRTPVTIQGDASHSIEYYATDVAGNNESVHKVNVKIDSVAPVTTSQVTGILRPDGSYDASVNITLTAVDGTSGVQSVQYRIDSGAWRGYTTPFPLAGDGTHIFESFAQDVAGNVEVVNTRSIRISGGGVHILPVSSLRAGGTMGASGWYVSRVAITLSATGGSGTSIAYHVDSGPWIAYASPFSIGDGRHVLEYQATDGAGYSEPLRSITIDVDSTPPTLVPTTNNNNAMRPDDPLSWVGSDSVSGVARYEVSIDGGPFQTVGLATGLSRHWTEGAHVVVVEAFDTAGNQASTVISFQVSGSAPTTPGSPSLPQSTSLVVSLALFLVFCAMAIGYGLRGKKRQSNRRRRNPLTRARGASKP